MLGRATIEVMFMQYVNVLDCHPDVEYTSWIRKNYIFLLDNLDVVPSGLLYCLYQDEVVDKSERDEVRSKRTSVRQSERLLSILGRKSPEKIELFFDALDKSGQRHIRNTITGRNEGKYC